MFFRIRSFFNALFRADQGISGMLGRFSVIEKELNRLKIRVHRLEALDAYQSVTQEALDGRDNV